MITHEQVVIDGYRMHYQHAGSGTPVLLLHGFAGSGNEWRDTITLLARSGYHAIAPDALGFGQSDTPADANYSFALYASLYTGLLDHLGIARATWVGHSFGGKCTLATALLRPERVNRIVIADSEGFIPLPFFMRKAGFVPKLAELFLAISKKPAIFRKQLEGTFYDVSKIPDDMVAGFQEILHTPARGRAIIRLSQCYEQHDLIRTGFRSRLGEISVPTLIVWGAHDRIFAPSCGVAAHREIPGSHVVFLPRCGHYPHRETPRAFHGILLPFLAKTAASAM